MCYVSLDPPHPLVTQKYNIELYIVVHIKYNEMKYTYPHPIALRSTRMTIRGRGGVERFSTTGGALHLFPAGAASWQP